MFEFWYNYIKPKYQNNEKLCYIDTNSFIINIKTEEFFEDIAILNVEKTFDTSNIKSIDHYLKEGIKVRINES